MTTTEGSFRLDGEQISFQAGQTIMDAAMAAGVYIPHLCHHPALPRIRTWCWTAIAASSASAACARAAPWTRSACLRLRVGDWTRA